MNNIGVVRKIDDLGRIVIPKEIRKTLNVRSGEDLQIFVDNESIVLTKYNKLLNLQETAQKYIDSFSKLTSSTILIVNHTNIVSSSNKNFINKKLDSKVVKLISSRQVVLDKSFVIDSQVYDLNYYIMPLIINTDLIGAIIILSNNVINDRDKTLAEVLSILLSDLIYA